MFCVSGEGVGLKITFLYMNFGDGLDQWDKIVYILRF